MNALTDTDWMDLAICRPDPAWTGDRMPEMAVLTRLGAICAACPVIGNCASYALGAKCELGMYAGVWLPNSGKAWGSQRGHNRVWIEARAALARKVNLVST